MPFQGQPGENKKQANDYKANEQNVKNQNRIGKKQIKGRVCHRHLV